MECIKDVDFVPGRMEVSAGCLQPGDLKTACTIYATNPDTTNDLAERAPVSPDWHSHYCPSIVASAFFFLLSFHSSISSDRTSESWSTEELASALRFLFAPWFWGLPRTPSSLLGKNAQGYGNQSSSQMFGTRRCNTFPF